jgi:hypothetical protein
VTQGRVIALAVAALAAAALVVAGTVGSTASESSDGALTWSEGAFSFEHETLAGDWIATGQIENGSREPIRIVATRDVKIVDSEGRELRSAAVFSNTVGHGLFDPTRVPEARLPEEELRRIGDVAALAPGEALPLTVSWHEETGGSRADRIEYPGGSLPIPERR